MSNILDPSIVASSQLAQPAQAPDDLNNALSWLNTNVGQPLQTGMMNAANSATLGIPGAFLSLTNKPAYQSLKQLTQQHPIASAVGDIAGALAIPQGEILKGLGTAADAVNMTKTAESLRIAGDTLAGAEGTTPWLVSHGQFLQGAAKGAVAGLEQGVPRAITSAVETQDPNALYQAPLSAVLGAGIGGVAGKLASKAPQLMQESAENADKMYVNGILGQGMSRQVQKAAKSGFLPTNYQTVNDMYSNLAQTMRDAGVTSSADMKGIIADNIGDFQALGDAWDSMGVKLADHTADIMQLPSAQELVNRTGASSATDTINGLIQQADKSDNLAGLSKYMNTFAKKGFRSDNVDNSYAAEVAQEIKEYAQNMAADALPDDPNLASMKQLYKTLIPVKGMLFRSESIPEGMAKESSATAFRLGMQAIMSGGGAALGGVGGAAAANVIGELANKASAGIANKASGFVAGQMAPGLDKLANSNFIQSLPDNATQIAGKLASVGSLVPTVSQDQVNQAPDYFGQPEPPIVEPMAKTLPELKNTPMAASSADPSVISSHEAQMAPQAVSDAQNHVNDIFSQKIQTQMYKDWANYYQWYGMSWNDFQSYVAQKTNNFDPKLSADILFRDSDQKSAFLATYDRSLQLKNIDSQKALNTAKLETGSDFLGKAGAAIKQWADDPGVAQDQKSLSDLLDVVGNLQGANKGVSKEDRAAILSKFGQIARITNDPAKRKQLIEQELQNNYGMNFALLKSLGLWTDSPPVTQSPPAGQA